MSERVYFISLGCAKNRVDSEVMLGRLQAQGYRITATPEQAEVIIVNTCSFIRSAVEESIENILEAARFKEQGLCRVLGVAGCFPQRYREELVGRLPEVDFFLGTESFLGIASHVREALARAGGTRLDLEADPGRGNDPQSYARPGPLARTLGKTADHSSGNGLLKNRGRLLQSLRLLHHPGYSRSLPEPGPEDPGHGGQVPGGPGGPRIDPGGPGHHSLRGRSFPACFLN